MNLKYPEIPSDEFLQELVERAKRHGWDGDYGEIMMFVERQFKLAGKECPNLKPYEDDQCSTPTNP